ncbi:MAG: PhzF family phenazine biosynthesis protein, partial [Clostridia bacterium]|nr:PhzF family phenazine biosynthesis protein [Clostridia bacterium]
MKQYIVDAFTSKPFSGNPAAVCVTDRPLPDEFMRNLAMENNLSETAYLLKEAGGYNLRWFTPGTEVDLCGHATLASSFVVLNYLEPESDVVRFQTRSGLLTVRRTGDLYRMDFPIYEQEEIPVTDAMEKAFGACPVRAFLGVDLVCVFEDEETVRAMTPDQTKLSGLPGRIQNATARGREADCVSRSFCP